ncbi:MAG TPA: M20/M25/M40 family metallo-hydrolase [Candidatus Angelobacter sp.]|nr:M20/M25/M40 family metallo-hydrolase [Candidatus Angelobacter sp.]
MFKRSLTSIVLILFVFVLRSAAQDEKIDLGIISRIRYEGFHNSEVMEIASGLVDGIGQRLTGSPNLKRANEWTRAKLADFGLANVHLEPWGPFGRGWSNEFINVRMVAPDIATLIAYPRAWTPGTNGALQGQVVPVEIRLTSPEMEADMAKYKGKLAGKFVLIGDDPEIKLPFDPLAERYDEKALEKIQQYAVPRERNPQRIREFQRRARLVRQIGQFFADERAIAVIEHSRGDTGGGTIFVDGGSYKADLAFAVPQLFLAAEHWDRIARLLKQKKDVQLEVNVKNTFYDDATTQYNTIAEIPGADKKDELVMLGAHLDSWSAGTGAADDGAGVAVMMEAVRILKAVGVKPRRTIRIGLWTGEEQNMLGSQWYVARHFGSRPPSTDPDSKDDPSVIRRENGPLTIEPEQAKVSVYFNLDNGSGKIRGVYLQENAAVEPIFRAWMKPFHDLGMDTLTMRNTGDTDHESFDAVGIPGFQFIQDPLDYYTRTHHSNMDLYERLQPDDLKQMAVIVASFVYEAAMRDQMLPRKPLEKELLASPPTGHK